MARPRRPRPVTQRFDVEALVDAWRPLCRIRQNGFEWDGSSYPSGHRGVPNLESLHLHAPALHPLLLLAPCGFPSHLDVEAAIHQLDGELSILKTPGVFSARASSLAADGWRTMCKHLYDLRLSGADCIYPVVAQLVALIEPHAVASPARPANDVPSLAAASSDAAPPAPDSLVPRPADPVDCVESSGDEVVLQHVRCICQECLAMAAVGDEATIINFIL